VAEFVGADRELKRLAVTPIPRDGLRPLEPDAAGGEPTVPASATLREALTAVLESETARVRVIEDGRDLGYLTAADIHAALRREPTAI